MLTKRNIYLMLVALSYHLIVVATRRNGHERESFSFCKTPFGIQGLCMPLKKCEYLYKIHLRSYLSRGEFNIMIDSRCGATGPQIMPPQCGIIMENRIFGGSETQLGEFPWMALLLYSQKDYICGGSLINERYVLTAGHCTTSIPQLVRLGESDRTTDPDCEGDQCAPRYMDFGIVHREIHPKRENMGRYHVHDIALLKLDRKVQINEFIKPICLPTSKSLRENDFEGKLLIVSGWGNTEENAQKFHMRKAEIKVWSRNKCFREYESNIMCAGGVKAVDSCTGDSGGPLMVLNSETETNVYYLIGIVSHGHAICGTENSPGFYTRVAPYVDWIQNNLIY